MNILTFIGELPLQGSIPDMTADSQSYIALQQVYREKAAGHVNRIHKDANIIKQSLEGVSNSCCCQRTLYL